MNRIFSSLAIFLFVSLAFSQNSVVDPKTEGDSSNVLEKIQLRFDLEGNPNPGDVGFDNPKSKWKLEYELWLSDVKTVHQLYSKMYEKCPETKSERLKCISKANKKIHKRYKKFAIPIAKGAFQKINLSDESNREITIPVNFTHTVINILNKSLQTADNPDFILVIKSSVKAKTQTKHKVKYKPAISFEYPLKLIRKDGSFDFYNITVMGVTVRVTKENDKISYGTFKN